MFICWHQSKGNCRLYCSGDCTILSPCHCGVQVVLAANEQPSINDITAKELKIVLGKAAGLDPDVIGCV
jgi:hypothetical protein